MLVNADVNQKLVAFNPSATQVPRLCLPFSQQGAIWIRNENPGIGCTVITATLIDVTYAPLRCPYNLPADTQPVNNAEYQV
jgi:hypothetical protein